MRAVPIYGTAAILALLFIVKLFYVSALVRDFLRLIFNLAFAQALTLVLTILIIASYRKACLIFS